MGGWGRCGLKELLPVQCLDYEDLIESTEGYTADVLLPMHPTISGLDFASLPPILGYNEVKPREDALVVAQWAGTGHPLLAVGQYGEGRTAAFTSDPAPHWGLNFVFWKNYNSFWKNLIDWLVKRK